MRFAQWGALLSQLHPRAVFSGFGVNVSGIPYSALDPDAPSTAPTRLLTMFVVPPNQPALTSATPDADYGTVAYGQYFDAAWHEMTTVNYSLTVSFTAPGAASSNDWQTGWYQETAGAVAGPIGPAIGTPRSPLVAAKNAFAPQSGVGRQPLLAWTAPSLGTPTEYIVTLRRLDTVGGATVFTDVLEAKIFGATSFRVPPGMLAMGSSYFATISAFQAPWDVIDHVFTPGPGGPYVSAECVTEAFSP